VLQRRHLADVAHRLAMSFKCSLCAFLVLLLLLLPVLLQV
jgi:hypothetical protein